VNMLLDFMNVDRCLNMLLVCRKLMIPSIIDVDDHEVACISL
jgi:hypothetical protein